MSSTHYFPTINGTVNPSHKLSYVIDHKFSDVPHWQQGIIASDSNVNESYKQYLALSNFSEVVDKLSHQPADAHLYELLAEDRPVRPYFDLEWDADQRGEEEVLLSFLECATVCLARVGFRGCHGISLYRASGRCSTNVVPSGNKASFHVLFDTVGAFQNVAHHKRFIESILIPYVKHVKELTWITTTHTVKSVVDSSPYAKHQLFRLPFQSKFVSGASRPLLPYSVEWLGYQSSTIYTAGIYSDPSELQMITLDEVVLHKTRRPTFHVTAGVESVEFPKLVGLCELLSSDFLCKYEETRNLIWLLWGYEQTERMRNHIHAVCKRGVGKYEETWVEDTIRSFTFMGFTIGTLVKWAIECGGKEHVHTILQTHQSAYHEELFRMSMKPKQHTVIHQRYLSSVEFTGKNDTMLIKSHLGTGKTVAITNLLRLSTINRLLIISPRKSYTYSQLGVFQEDTCLLPPLESYMDHMGSLSHLPYLIVQVESLHRIGEWFQPYDMVIMDESESILHQLHSVMTNGDNLMNNHQVLDLVLRTAKQVILADAFMTDRTFHAVRELRNPETTCFIENTYQPYSREAILLQQSSDQRVPAMDGFIDRIMTALRTGRRIIVVWTSKSVGEAFEENHLKPAGFSYLFYHSDTDKEHIAGLRDVSTNWSAVQCLMMTTSITVGISYDPRLDEFEFDEAFLYGNSTTALPRDIAQSLLRVRVLKANRLTYVTNIPSYAVEECGFTNVCQLLTEKEERVTKDHPLTKWVLCPAWAKWNYIYNENERRCSCTYYKDVLERYLTASGYTLTTAIHDVEVLAQPMAPHMISMEDENEEEGWYNIMDITDAQAEEIRVQLYRGEADRSDKRQYQKHVFRSQFVASCSEEEMCAVWCKYDGKMEQFWNVVMEKRWTVEDMCKAEAKKRYAIMSTQRIKRRETMDRFLKMMGMEHSQQAIVLSHEDLVELGGSLCEAEVSLRSGMGLRASRRKGEWKVGNTIDLITVMLEEWGGSEVRTKSSMVKINRKVIKNHTLYINENNYLWNNIEHSTINMDQFLIKF